MRVICEGNGQANCTRTELIYPDKNNVPVRDPRFQFLDKVYPHMTWALILLPAILFGEVDFA